jgi:hypothetical protein
MPRRKGTILILISPSCYVVVGWLEFLVWFDNDRVIRRYSQWYFWILKMFNYNYLAFDTSQRRLFFIFIYQRHKGATKTRWLSRNFYLRIVCHFQILILLFIFKDRFYNVTNFMFYVLFHINPIITESLYRTSFYFKCSVPHCFVAVEGQGKCTKSRDRQCTEIFQLRISSHLCVVFCLWYNSQNRV